MASLGISDNEVLKRTRLWDQTRSHWHLWQGERIEEAGCVAEVEGSPTRWSPDGCSMPAAPSPRGGHMHGMIGYTQAPGGARGRPRKDKQIKGGEPSWDRFIWFTMLGRGTGTPPTL